MSRINRRFLMLGTGLVATMIGGGGMFFFIVAIGSVLLDNPLNAANSENWLFWIGAVGIGFGSLIGATYLALHKWNLGHMESEPRNTIVKKMAIIGALLGVGVGILYFELTQIGAALLLWGLFD